MENDTNQETKLLTKPNIFSRIFPSGVRAAFTKKNVRTLLVAIVALASVTALIVVALQLKLPDKLGLFNLSGEPTPTPINEWTPAKPTPLPLAHGTQTYRISGSTLGAPKISEVTFDPLDPASDQNQTMIVNAFDGNGSIVKTVTVTLNTDNKGEIHSLTHSQGTAQNGIWQGSWKISDSYDDKYTATVRAENAAGVAQTSTITLR